MRRFTWDRQREAIRWAAAGGQALHLHGFGVGESAPAVFKAAVRGRKNIAHLFDWNEERLAKTSRALGVTRLHIDRAGTAAMHADLCGRPLEKATELSYVIAEDALAVSAAWNRAVGRLWMLVKGLSPLTVYRGSAAEKWNWTGLVGCFPIPLSGPGKSDGRRGTAWLSPEWTQADEKARVPAELFRAMLRTRTLFTSATLIDDDGWTRGIIYRSREDAFASTAAGFSIMAAADLNTVCGPWSECDAMLTGRIDEKEFAARHLKRFRRPPDERDYRMAFGPPVKLTGAG